jgi:hypothetical protein
MRNSLILVGLTEPEIVDFTPPISFEVQLTRVTRLVDQVSGEVHSLLLEFISDLAT